VRGRPLVYLDNAATTQKPRAVIEALVRYYETANANVHRAIHALGEEATEQYEAARAKVAAFIGARDPATCVFVRNTTEAINLVAYAWARHRLRPGDEIVVTLMEHHSNLVPWQLAARATGARLRFVGLREDGSLDRRSLDEALGPRTRLVAVAHVSNVLGTVNPVKEIAARAHAVGALCLVDGAQSAPHMPVDVADMDCDFFAFSGHKMYGPMGIGVLYGKREHLEAMEPFLGGGEMIREVRLEDATWNDVPWKFEAGTPNVAGAVGLGAAVDYLRSVGFQEAVAYERELTRYALGRLAETEGVVVYGPRGERGDLVTFNLGDVHPHDLSQVLDAEGVAIRAGHHCCQPLMRHLGVAATARASFAFYNTREEVDALVDAVEKAREFFAHVAR
jgi:cysteine desulfurase/selenocysteine lyase